MEEGTHLERGASLGFSSGVRRFIAAFVFVRSGGMAKARSSALPHEGAREKNKRV
jgi:hypothetical protein